MPSPDLSCSDLRLPRILRRLALTLTLGVSTAPIHAQTDGPESAKAHLQFRTAHEAILRSDWAEARRLLLELWNEHKTYDVAASLAQVEFRENNYALSARYMTYALAHIPPTETPAKLQAFKQGLAEAQEHLCTLSVSVDEPGAAVRVDGELVGTSPLPSSVYLAPGSHTVEALLTPERTRSRRLECAAGSAEAVHLELPAASSAAPAPATSPSFSLSPAPDESSPPSSASPTKSIVPVVVGGVITAAGVATWLGYWAAANGDKEDAEGFRDRLGPDACSSGSASSRLCSSARDTYDSQRRNAALSRIGLGTWIVAGSATLGYVLFWPAPKTKNTRVGFVPELHGASVAVTGSF